MSLGEAFDAPYDWRVALKFEEAWDYTFLREFIEQNQLFNLRPQAIVLNNTEEIRAASGNNQLIVYVPYNTTLRLKGNYSEYEITIIELETRKKAKAICQLKPGSPNT